MLVLTTSCQCVQQSKHVRTVVLKDSLEVLRAKRNGGLRAFLHLRVPAVREQHLHSARTIVTSGWGREAAVSGRTAHNTQDHHEGLARRCAHNTLPME